MSTVFSLQAHILKATFPYSEHRRIPNFHHTPDLGFGMLLYFSSMWREWFGQWIFAWCENNIPKTLVCLSRFGLGLGTEFVAVSIGLSWFSRRAFSKISALEGTCALHRRHRTPQVSSHSPHILRYHRAPERASHATKIFVFGTRNWFYNCFVSTVFFLLFLTHLKPLEFHIRSHSMQIWFFWAHGWFFHES